MYILQYIMKYASHIHEIITLEALADLIIKKLYNDSPLEPPYSILCDAKFLTWRISK